MTSSKLKDKPSLDFALKEEVLHEAQPAEEMQKVIELAEKVTEGDPNAVITMMSAFKGPLPPPEILRGYEDIKDGLADRIVSMAEKEQEVYLENSKTILKFQGRDTFMGMLFAFMTISLTLFMSCILLLNDKNIAGFCTLIGGLVALAGLFVKGHANKKDEKKIVKDETDKDINKTT